MCIKFASKLKIAKKNLYVHFRNITFVMHIYIHGTINVEIMSLLNLRANIFLIRASVEVNVFPFRFYIPRADLKR